MVENHFSIELDINAEISIDESFQFYENRQKDLGLRFIQSVENTFINICKNPLLYSSKDANYRVAAIKKFPFLILYRVNNELKVIYILEVFHTSRNPENRP